MPVYRSIRWSISLTRSLFEHICLILCMICSMNDFDWYDAIWSALLVTSMVVGIKKETNNKPTKSTNYSVFVISFGFCLYMAKHHFTTTAAITTYRFFLCHYFTYIWHILSIRIDKLIFFLSIFDFISMLFRTTKNKNRTERTQNRQYSAQF